MQGCEYFLRQRRGAVSAVAMFCLWAGSWAYAQPVVDHIVGDAPVAGDVAYATDSGYVADPGECYSPYGMNYSPSLGAHLRARYNTRSYGQVEGNLDLGTMRLWEGLNGMWFVDGQVTLNDETKVGYNAGIGYRFMTLPLLPFSSDHEKIAGISLWSDGQMTLNDNFISQIGISTEYLGDTWDVRGNVYLPTSGTEVGEFVATDNVTFSGDFLVQETIAGTDEALNVVEAEVARRLGNRDVWAFAGGYGLYGDTVDTEGFKVGMRGYLTPDLAVQFAVNDDDQFGTNSVFSVTWFIGRTRDPSYCSPSLAARMREPVVRNDYIAINQGTTTGGTPLEGDVNGDGINELIQVVHVDSTAAAGGDGSFENPLNNLADINSNSSTNSIVLLHGGSTFTNDAAVLQDGQRMLGEGGSVEHIVGTTQFGDVVIPETAVGAQTGAIPTVTNAAGNAVTLAAGTIEVSNLSIDGGASGIVAPSGSLGVDINNVSIANTTGDGIVLTPGSETVDGDLMVRFQPMLTNLTFTNIGGDDIDIDGTSPEAASVPITENIVISDVTSTLNGGLGIRLANNNRAASITNYTNDLGSSAAGGGILLSGNQGAVTITDSTITNQAGFGVSVVDSDANHTFNGMTITDTAGAAMHVSGGTGDVSFTGKIEQGDTGAALLVENGHTGALDFFEATTDAGVIDASFGDGLVFDNADGTYTFTAGVSITGTTQGIDVSNGSDGTITLIDGTITDPNGVAVHVDGGDASINYTGTITQSNAFDTVFVENGHTGTLLFVEADSTVGLINATNGDGLQFDNADGTYRFTGAVVLDGSGNGADTAIDMLNDTDGTFEFSDATIIDPTGAAVTVVGGSSVFTLTGDIQQNNNVATISVTGNHDGDMTFLSTDGLANVITATNGTGLQFNGADGNYSFVGPVELDGSSVAADTAIDILNSDGVFTFGETTITDPTGIAMNIVGGDADVNFTGNINQSNNVAAVSVTGNHTGTTTFTQSATGGVVNATNGTGLQFTNADGSYSFNSAVVLNGGDAGVDIVNSDGVFNFNSASEITNPTGDAFVVTGGTAAVDYNGTIVNNSGHAVRIEGNTGGSVRFDGLVTDTAQGILVQNNTGGAFSFGGGTDLDTTTNDAVTLANNSGTTISFTTMNINTTSGDGFVATATEGLTVIGLNNVINTTTGVGLNLDDVDVGAAGVSLESVSVNGAANGIVLNDVRGGPVDVGFGGTSQGDGGTITTTGDGVVLTNVEDVSLNFVSVTNSGAAGVVVTHDGTATTDMSVVINNSLIRGATAEGVTVDASSSNTFNFDMNNNTLDTNGADSVAINVNGSASTANITIDGNTINNTSGNSALAILGDGVTAKTINLLVQDNSLTNSAPAADTVNLTANHTGVTNATFLNNTVLNGNNVSGQGFVAETTAAGTDLRMRLEGNVATAPGAAADYILTETAGTFQVQNLNNPVGDTITDNNTGTFSTTGVSEFPGVVPQP